MLKTVLLIGAGGFIGSVARYFVSRLNLYFDFLAVPAGTLIVNVLGSFLLGFLMAIAAKSVLLDTNWRMFLMVGVCGGFTTFSTFSGENLVLMQNGQFLSVLLYTALTILLGFIAVYLGYITSNLL